MSKEFFDQIASDWDGLRKGYFTDVVRDNAFAIAGIKPGKTAADIGAGTGFMSEGLAKYGLKVIAIDQSEPMLEVIRKKLGDSLAITYQLGNAEKLPIEDASVDYVFANMTLHHVAIPINAISEMRRILKPDGKLIITDLDSHNYKFLKNEHHDIWMGFKREDIIKWYQQAGFNLIFVDDVEEFCCAKSECGCYQAKIGMFLALGIK